MNEVIGQARDKGSEEFTVNLTSELIDGEGDPDKTKSVRDACLVHIYPTGAGMGTRYPIAEQPLTIGRSSDCQIRIGDNSVSRHHVRINVGKLGHQFRDLESTNGTLVNNRRVPGGRLRDGDYLRVGNHIFRYLAGGNVEAEYHEELHRLAIIDGLTEIHNKRFLTEFLERELVRAARHLRPLSLIMIDIDNFKSLNDAHGHLSGDFVLREIATHVKVVIREDELFARYGGEEFAIVLPETAKEEAVLVAERVRSLIAERQFLFDGKQLSVTVSLGVAAREGDGLMKSDELIRQADERLYLAKNRGRNRVEAGDPG